MNRIIKNRFDKKFLIIIIIIILFFFFAGSALVHLATKKSITTTPIVGIQSQWNTLIAKNYSDEPKDLYPAPVKSDTGWIIPTDPFVIRQVHIPEDENLDNLLRMTSSGTSKSVLSDKDINEIWSNSGPKIIDLDEFVKANNLPEIISLYFYRETRMPLKIWDEDISGDGVKDQLFTSVGLGCTSCHTIFVDAFVKGAGIFSTETNKGTIYPRADKKGFYLDTAYTGNDLATCCTDNFVLSKYEWNGNGFTEIARKKIKY